MNGELAALIAQCLHGNEWLASGTGPAPTLDTSNSTFQYVSRLHSTCPQRRFLGRKTWEADGVAPWLEFLRDSGTRRLSLVVAGSSDSGLPDHLAVSFAGGGRWALASDGPLPRLWRSRWAVQDRDRPDRRIWTVEQAGTPVADPWPARDVEGSAREDLRRALEGIREYADRAGLDEWARWFAEALRLLDSPDPVIPYNPDLAPASLPPGGATAAGRDGQGLGVLRDGIVERHRARRRRPGAGVRTADCRSLLRRPRCRGRGDRRRGLRGSSGRFWRLLVRFRPQLRGRHPRRLPDPPRARPGGDRAEDQDAQATEDVARDQTEHAECRRS